MDLWMRGWLDKTCVSMIFCMDGWMVGLDEWVGGWIFRCLDVWITGWIDVC